MAQTDTPHAQETASATLYLEDGIIFAILKDHSVVDLEEAKRHSEAFRRLTDGKPSPLLIVFGKMRKQTKEARDFFSRNPAHVELYTAAAMLVKNPLAKVFANFYLGMNRPARPTRMFTDRERALEWLAQFKQPPE